MKMRRLLEVGIKFKGIKFYFLKYKNGKAHW